MIKFKLSKFVACIAVIGVVVTGCTPSRHNKDSLKGNTSVDSVEVTDIHGRITVPVNPERIVSLDNRTFETLSDWDIQLAAVPKGVMPKDSEYVLDESVLDIGNHSDPNLEIIAAVDPQLVIIGQRFAKYYEEIKELVPNAVVIDINFDVSEETTTPGDNLVSGLIDSTLVLGKIFDKNIEAENIINDLNESIDNAKASYKNDETVMSVIVSGGEIGFSAPRYGRVWGPIYDILALTPAFVVDGTSSNHTGDDISVEAIAQNDPDWIFVLDRDAAVSSVADAVPAKDIIYDSPALKATKAVLENKIVYAPNDTYTNESIQTYIELFGNIATAFNNQ